MTTTQIISLIIGLIIVFLFSKWRKHREIKRIEKEIEEERQFREFLKVDREYIRRMDASTSGTSGVAGGGSYGSSGISYSTSGTSLIEHKSSDDRSPQSPNLFLNSPSIF